MFFVYIWCDFDNLEALFLKIDYMYFYMCMKQLYWVVKSNFLLNVNLIFSCLFNMKQQQDSCSLDTQPI